MQMHIQTLSIWNKSTYKLFTEHELNDTYDQSISSKALPISGMTPISNKYKAYAMN